jgi:hypothetical protein
MYHLYSRRHSFAPSSVHYIVLLTIFSIWFFPRVADSCSVIHTLDIIQLCSIDDYRVIPTAQIDLDFADDYIDDDVTRQEDYYYMLGNFVRQTTRSLRFSPSPLRSSVSPPLYSSSRAFMAGHTLASTSNPNQTNTMAPSSTPAKPSSNEQHENLENETSNNPKLALPAVPREGENTSEAQKLDVSGTTVSLDHLGPIVVNQDGTMSRISNWDKMTEIEKKNTIRIIGKRNKQRLEALKAAGVGEGEGSVS